MSRKHAYRDLTVLHCSWTSSCVVAFIVVLDASYKRLPIDFAFDCCIRLSPPPTMAKNQNPSTSIPTHDAKHLQP